MDLSSVIIETRRMVLKPITLEYTEIIYACFDTHITKYMYPKPPDKKEETRQFITGAISRMKEGTDLQFVIIKKETNSFVGCAGIHDVDSVNPELGIWVRLEEHGNGYGLEAVTETIQWAKKNIEFEYLKYPVDKRNFASRRIPELNGGLIKCEYKKRNLSNFELDEVEYWIYR